MRQPVRGTRWAILVVWCLVTLLTASVAGIAQDNAQSEARMAGDVGYLASDKLEGRGVGTHGLDLAAEYVAKQFDAAGLRTKVVADKPFQQFAMTTGATLGEPNELALIGPQGQRIELSVGRDFVPVWFGGDGPISGPLAFIGYGIEGSEQGYDDYANLDVTGKVVVIMRRVPQQNNPHGLFAGNLSDRFADLRTKVSTAYQHGAKAVLFVTEPRTRRDEVQARRDERSRAVQTLLREGTASLSATDEGDRAALEKAVGHLKGLAVGDVDPLMPFGYPHVQTVHPMPLIHVKAAVIDRVLRESLGTDLGGLETTIDVLAEPQSARLDRWSVEGQTTIQRQTTEVKNVIAVLEGQGPHAEETIVVGAHYDHLGYGDEGSLAPGSHEIHNGADDNASGTAGILELARRLAARSEPLPRRIVFIAFTAEERGLIGSAHYVSHPVVPLDETVAMINLDMVGRLTDDKLTIFGTGTAKRWESLLAPLAEQHHLVLTSRPDGFGPSDQSSFYAHQIPVLHFFTGNHSDYHRPSDDVDKINVEGMRRVVDLIEQVIVDVAQTEARPQYVAVARPNPQRRAGSRPYFGSIPDFGRNEKGYAIQGVGPGSPADQGGLKGGDVIVKLGDRNIGGLEDFDAALRAYKPGETVPVVVQRDGKPLTLKVTLGRPR
jgi:hypothetical protein